MPEPITTQCPVVVVEAAGISVRHNRPMTPPEAKHVAMRLLEAATASLGAQRELRRPASVDDELRGRDE